jgi:hypothetical protein
MRRSPVPLSITDPDEQEFLDKLYKRVLPAMDDLPASPTTTEIATFINAWLAAMRANGSLES